MTISDQQFTEEFDGKEEEVYTENGGSDSESNVSDDSTDDPPFDILEEAQSKFSNLSVEKKPRVRVAKDMDSGSGVDEDEVEIVAVPELDEKDKQSFEHVEKTIQAGQLEKLKVDQCKVYLRKYGLRLTGSKEILIRRIKEHQEIINGDGEKKYPVSSFVLNCKGDACTGDVVMFEQNVYDMYNLASRSASGPPCGTRMVAGRIVKESYGAAKQQHTFTIEVLWTKGEKPLPSLHPLLIKGRNLYRLKTLRQRWEDEGERQRILMDKHSRGAMARSKRETRIQGKEKRKMLTTGVSKKEEPKNKQPQLNPTKFDFSIDPRKVTIQHPQNQTENINPNQSFKLQHSKPFENYMQPNFPPTLLNAYPKASHLIAYPLTSLNRQPAISATQRQPLTSLNHHPAIGATQRQPLTSLNHHPAIGAMQRQPLTSLNHHPAFVAPQRQSLTNLNHHPAFVATQRQPLTSVNYDPAIIARQRQPFTSLKHHPAMSATQRQPLQSLNHYPAVRAIQRQPLTGMDYCRSPSPKHRQSVTGMNHFRSPSPNHRQPLTRPGQRQQGHMQQLPCRYYTQGRCSLGDRCKFLHESREESDQWRDERLRHY